MGTAWYIATSAVLGGGMAQAIPVLGAIALSGMVPTIIMNRAARRKLSDTRLSLSQRLDALDKHACINITNEMGELTEVNDMLLELSGYKRGELINKQVSHLYGDDGATFVHEIQRHLERGENWIGETPLRRKDGAVIYFQSTVMPLFDAAGEWCGAISVRTDVTKTNELISERQTAQTLYELHDDIWIIDSETEEFSYLNRSAKGRLNLSAEDYRGTNLKDMSVDHDIGEVLAACRTLRASGGDSMRFETSTMGMSADVTIKFLHGADGAGRFLILFNDISDRVEQEQSKAAFISTVSHELRSPLTSIKGAMGLLLSRSAGDMPDKALALLEIAHRNADRLILIINDILDLDKISNGQMDLHIKEVDLVDLIKETDQANAMLQQRFGVCVEMKGMDTPVLFRTDPNRFIQIMTNLLSNAYKFSKPNSKIVVDLKNEGDHVRVAVQDEGQGIPLGEQHKIFHRFADMANSDRASKGGTGLGLNICKAIVENLGGTIDFDTKEDVGTTFFFELPKKLPDHLETIEPVVERSA